MKQVAIFGSSWSDAFYDNDWRQNPSICRSKIWSEFIPDYVGDVQIDNYAISGSALDRQLVKVHTVAQK